MRKNKTDNMKTYLKTLAIIAACVAPASCSQDPINPEENKQTQQGTTITIEAMLSEDVQKAMSPRPAAAAWMGNEETEKTTRTPIATQSNGDVVYNWQKGAKIPLYVYITDGTNHETLPTTELAIESTTKGRFKVSIPAKYDLTKVKIAVATGKENNVDNGAWAASIDNNGKITIGTPTSVNVASNEYNIPLYAKLTPIDSDGKGGVVQLKMLGSWIGVRAKSDMYYASNIQSIALESDVLHMDGELDLSTETPTWTAKDYRINIAGKEKSDTISLKGFTIGGPSAGVGTTKYTKSFYVWAKADPSKTSTAKARVYIRDEASSTAGPIYTQENNYSLRNKFYREAKEVVQFVEGDTYQFGINASLADAEGGLILTEYYHNTIGVGEYNWIEITNATNKTISLDGYYLVSPNPAPVLGKTLYVSALKDLSKLDRSGNGVGMPENSVTSIPPGRSICLASGMGSQVGYNEVVNKRIAYQVVNTKSRLLDPTAVSGGDRLPKFICKGGWNVDFNDPNNNIVDNLGVKVVYNPTDNTLDTYYYYMGAVDFLRTKEGGMNVPQKTFLPEAWSYMDRVASGFDYFGRYNDKDSKYHQLTGYSGSGASLNFQKFNHPMSFYTTIKHQPQP